MFNSNIHLNLYSDKAYVIAQLIKKALKNGTAMPRRTACCMQIEHDLTNETVIRVNDSLDRYYYYRSKWNRFDNEHDAKDWLANYLKRWLIDYNGRSPNVWNRSNTNCAFTAIDLRATYDIESTTDITYADIYFIYDYLKERKRALKMYDDSFVNAFKGEACNSIEVEMKRARIEELAHLQKERDDKAALISKWYYDEIEAVKEQLKLEREKRFAVLNAEYDKKMAEVDNIKINANELMDLMS